MALISEWQKVQSPAEFVSNLIKPIETETISTCPVCHCQYFKEHAVGFDYESMTCNNPWRFVACENCGHVWLNPRPILSSLPVIYPPTYYAYNYKAQINPIAVWGKEVLDGLKMKTILRQLKKSPLTYLDIGCGDGRFLKVMEKQGVPRNQNYGLELDEKVAYQLSAKGYQVYSQRVENCTLLPENQIDLITMFHVIEHVDDPRAVIRKIVHWLSPNGVLAIETPNIDSFDARIFKQSYWGGYHFPRHWNLFIPSSLKQLLVDNGLEVISTQYQTGHSFWMWSFHHRLRYSQKSWPKLARMFNPMRGLPFLIMFTVFDKLRAMLGFQTSAMLMIARKKIT